MFPTKIKCYYLTICMDATVRASGTTHRGFPAGNCAYRSFKLALNRWRLSLALKAMIVSTVILYYHPALESDGEGPLLRPGTFVLAKIPGKTYERALAIPRDAFVDQTVYLVVDGRARAVKPTVKRVLSDLAVIESGVEEGSHVILTNLEALYDGHRVALEETAPTSSEH